jgi:hypothetical protein
MLVKELPNARLVKASSILELRVSPERLTGEIVSFIDESWGGPAAGARDRSHARTRSPNGTSSPPARRP